MGKRSKMHKTGIPKTLLKKKSLNKTIMNINPKMMNQTMIANHSIDEDEPITQAKMNKSINQSVQYDAENLKKYGSLLGLTDKDMESLATNPIRNRRMVNNKVLSRRQKKKVLIREKKKAIEVMEHNTKLNLSQAYPKSFLNNTFAPVANKNSIPVPVTQPKQNFNLDDLDKEISSLEKSIVNKNVSSISSSKFRSKRRNMKFLNEEKANIESVINKSSFKQNPLEAMAMHIKTSQLVTQRNQKIKEDYNKNYNMLNLK